MLNNHIIKNKDENELEETGEIEKIEKDLDKNIDIPQVFSDDHVKNYLQRISEYSPLTREEEYEIGKKIQKGDKKALEKLILSNLKFVVTIANRYKVSGMPLADLINQGNVGLLEAAKRFDPDKGVKFISYAVWWIRQSIVQSLAEQSGTVKLPIKQASILYKINEAIEHLTKKLGREPRSSEIAKYLDIDEEDIENILRVSRNYLSLEAPIKEGEDRTFIDFLETKKEGVENEIIHKTLSDSLNEIIEELPERERNIIIWRFGINGEAPKTLEEIGNLLSISRERVRQVEARALNRLKKKALKRKLVDFLN
ncbi:MAG: RNA polymerase sigma factor RpoD/SigA [Deferribacterota bacterium]|nr:RNA polymerase sigma factor RpoD/SigA [Deferribacterota bacterium]